MNQQFSNIELLIQQSALTEEEKQKLLKEILNAEKQWNILEFELDHTEKVKKTTAVLLEETIEELENKRKSVEAQNRELEIESSLERVRTVAMSMQEPADMLEICKTISLQLKSLNVKEIRNVQTAIFYESKGTDMNYEYYAKHNKTFITETTYSNNEIHNAFADQMLKGNGEFFITHIKGDEVKDWIAYQKTTNVFIDDYLNAATSLNYYWYSLGAVALGISTYEPLSENDTSLFKRFLKVFELSYTRYLDIERAIVQARESQIQLALERVRARTMAMQKSDELAETVSIVFKQLIELGIKPAQMRTCAIVTLKPNEPIGECWITNPDGEIIAQPFTVSYDGTSTYNTNIYKAWKQGEKFLVIHLAGEALVQHLNYLKKHAKIPTQQFQPSVNQPTETFTHVLFFSQGYLLIISNEALKKYYEIFKRFAAVFEQTYTRFLDLQKAEAQAREAQIEAALEKVRSRSLAVYKSSEFNEVIKVVFERLQELEIPMTSASINIVIEGSKDTESYICGFGEGGLTLSHIRLIYFDHPIANDRYNAYEKGLEFFTNTYNKEEKNSFFEYEFEASDLKHIPADIKKMVMESKRYTISVALTKNSMIVVNDFEGKPLSSKQIDIVKRFSKVFEQAYIRFLDLQKAEAQAREAEIELGLERVRSRAMAMQTSEELNALIGTVFTELTKLDLVLTRCVILIYEGNEKGVRWWMANSETPSTPMNFFVKYADMPFFNEYLKGWYNRELKWQYCLEDENKIKTDGFLFNETELSLLPDFVIEGMKAPDRVYLNASFNNFGNLTLATLEPLSEEHFNILLRFAKVFDLTYTRFNDLKQAEAQTREAQIEAALERVRSKTMAMYKHEDLLGVLGLLVEQLIKLGVQLEVANFSNGIPDADWDLWIEVVRHNGTTVNNYVHFPRIEHPYFHQVEKNIETFKTTGKDLFKDVFSKEDKDLWQQYVYAQTIYKDITTEKDWEYIYDKRGYTWSMIFLKDTWVSICRYNSTPFSDEEDALFRRFANAFGQAYTRFLDLQKAEAQAREAQIETSLERVRSKTMAMHNSADVGETVAVMFDELVKLGIHAYRCGIGIMHDENKMEVWTAKPGADAKVDLIIGWLNMNLHPLLQGAFKGWNNKEESFSYHLKDDDLINYFNAVNDYAAYPVNYDIASLPKEIFHNDFYFSEGSLFAFSLEKLSEEKKKIIKRFSAVFGQTYRRYLDLQKAEVQVREALIEAALERVRSRSLAVHKSDEFKEVIKVVFERLQELGFQAASVSINIFIKDSNDTDIFICGQIENGLMVSHFLLPYFNSPIQNDRLSAQKNNLDFFTKTYNSEEKNHFYDLAFELPDLKLIPGEIKKMVYDSERYTISCALAKNSMIIVNDFGGNVLSENEIDIIKRFARVFEQAYIRFLDLQKAEAQAREAQIEAALERVRGKAMAMHSSKDLAETIHVFYHEIELLSATPRRCGVGLMNKESRVCKLSTMTTTEEGEPVEVIGKLDLQGHPVLDGIYNNWLNQKEYHPVLRGNEIKEYYKLLRPQISYPDYPNDMAQYGYFFFFPEGGVFAWTEKELPEVELQIYRRFTSVLSLTYKRCHELQQAEANAKEAVKQSALDRIRADIASMRTVSDLDRITPLIWNELTILGVPFIRCGVFIMNDEQQLIHTFLSTPDGKAIAAFQIPYDTAGNIKHVISHWRESKNYIDHWDEDAFTTFAKTLVEQGALASPEQYLKTIPHGGFYLHFLPFLQGMLYVGNTTQLSEDEIDLIQSLADAFSTAYARYEDFNKLEAAKKQVDRTLVELKQTQQQLVQSEKMASLGELTAGIAHEIQNPLNFVNNFSEVNEELLIELIDEFNKGNAEEAKAIANDIKQNLEKINHHGKRADAIVKGMLQHSQKSTGQKEPTDINALVDEYVRLCYHGLRAKDKSFNSNIQTDFDASIQKINIVPQDVGRVVLNILTNAFYAVNEKKKSYELSAKSYEPLVSITTKKVNNKIEISVADNGNGIPQNIIDKIFQPFFTTKPTGQGTGLGLSLAYDIIKAHRGEIKVETREGEGSIFIIQLPINEAR